jgi:hypothetical protein
MTDHPARRRRVGTALALVAAGLVGGLAATAAAGPLFNDVPAEGVFAEHITNVQQAGIATGFSDGSFRPTRALNRQQAAAWIDRSAARSTLDFADQVAEHTPVNPGDPIRELATIEMTSPAVGDGGGWVILDGYVAAATQNATGLGCPCAFDVSVVDGEGNDVAIGLLTAPGPLSDDERTTAGPTGIAPVQGAVWLPAGETETYTLVVELHDADVGNVFVAGTLSGQYSPMAEGEPTVHGDLAPTDSAGSGPVSLVPEG